MGEKRIELSDREAVAQWCIEHKASTRLTNVLMNFKSTRKVKYLHRITKRDLNWQRNCGVDTINEFREILGWNKNKPINEKPKVVETSLAENIEKITEGLKEANKHKEITDFKGVPVTEILKQLIPTRDVDKINLGKLLEIATEKGAELIKENTNTNGIPDLGLSGILRVIGGDKEIKDIDINPDESHSIENPLFKDGVADLDYVPENPFSITVYFKEDTQELKRLPIVWDNCYYLGEFSDEAMARIQRFLDKRSVPFTELQEIINNYKDLIE